MSSSVPCNIQPVLKIILKNLFLKSGIPKEDLLKKAAQDEPLPLPNFKILDVGFGHGKWGFLIRDTFDVMMGQNLKKEDWKIDITGVDVFEKNITPLQKILYNKIINKDISAALENLEHYDIIILGDVIEHFEKKEAYKLLDKLFKYSKNIIISTPLGFMPQGEWAGNKHETHRSGWSLDDFNKYKIIEHSIEEDKVFDDFIPLKLMILWIQEK